MRKIWLLSAVLLCGLFVLNQSAFGIKPLVTLEEQADPKHSAVIIIDMQNDFVADEGVAAKGGGDIKRVQAIVPSINQLVTLARNTGVPVIWVTLTHSLKDVLPYYHARSLEQAAKKGKEFEEKDFIVCEGTWGAELYDKMIKPLPKEIQIRKYGYGAFTGTPLDMHLNTLGIRTLLITGTNTNACCLSTGVQAHHAGYYPIMVSDCVNVADAYLHESTLKNFDNRFGRVASSEQITKIWKKEK